MPSGDADDPQHWKRLNENFQARVERERDEVQRRRESHNSILIVTAIVAVPLLVMKWLGSVVDTTIINGKVVMAGRKLTRVDERRIVREANAAFLRTKDKMVVVRR